MKKNSLILSFLLFLFSALPARAQQIFIKVNSPGTVIEGESIVKGHEKEIIAMRFAQEASTCDLANPGSGGGTCKATTSSFAFDMSVSKAITGLRSALYKGTRLDKVEITFVKPGSTPFEYYKIVLGNVLVSKITDATDGTSHANQVQFSAGKFFWTYTFEDPNSGQTTKFTFGWDTQTNTEWNGI